MSSSINDTEIPVLIQGVDWNDEEWQRLLRERLPDDWQEQAIKTKAWQRTRKLASRGDLLRALLVYAMSGYSFRQLGIWATLVGLGSLSERAWRKRVQRAGDWIGWLMGALIGTQVTPNWIHQGLGRILLVDATRFKQPAGTGDDMRLHCAYDLRAGRLAHVERSDCHGAEGLHPTFRSFFREFRREAILYCRAMNKLYFANPHCKRFCEKCKCKLRNVGYTILICKQAISPSLMRATRWERVCNEDKSKEHSESIG